MGADDLKAWLMFGTLGAALVIAIIVYLRFMRKPENRHPMDGQRERSVDEMRDDSASPATENRPRI